MTSTKPKTKILRLFITSVLLMLSNAVYPAIHTITGSNFTMLDGTGGLVGGATDVVGTFDDSKICFDENCTDIAMTLASNQPFFGVPWVAHDIRIFGPGSYTIQVGFLELPDGTIFPIPGEELSFTVAPGQLGTQMFFDWSGNNNIGVANVWDVDTAFGSPIYDGCTPPTPPEFCDPTQSPSRIWNLTSTDNDGDGINGIPMVNGPFIGFNANFNLQFTPPVASDDSAGTIIDTAVPIDVLNNDVEGGVAIDPTSVALTALPANGSALVDAATGTVTYTPNGGFLGVDNFAYTVNDINGSTSNAATVTVTVSLVANTPPVANNVNFSVSEDISLDIAVTDTDDNGVPVASDVDGDTLIFAAFDASSVQNGTITANGTNTVLTYTPAANFSGTDTFNFTVNDGIDDSNTGTVTVTVNPVDDPLVCGDVSLTTSVDDALPIDVADDLLSTCNDADGDMITLASTTQPTQPGSTLSDDGAGTLTYTPAPGFEGDDTFTYTATDGTSTDTKTVTVSVTGQIFGNFTMLDGDGVTFGGTNDIVFTWDSTCYNSVAEADAGPINMIMGSDSDFPFFGFPWFAHDIKVYCPGGPYTIDTCNAGVTPPDCAPLTFTVPADHLGGHILFDWNVTADIDVAIVWNNSTGGTWQNVVSTGQLYQGPAGPTPALDEFYEWISVDADGDGIPGIQFVDGPFINFRANFNFKTTESGGGEVEIPVSTVPSPNLGSTCSISKTPRNVLNGGDWLVLSAFIAWLGIGVNRRRHQKMR